MVIGSLAFCQLPLTLFIGGKTLVIGGLPLRQLLLGGLQLRLALVIGCKASVILGLCLSQLSRAGVILGLRLLQPGCALIVFGKTAVIQLLALLQQLFPLGQLGRAHLVRDKLLGKVIFQCVEIVTLLLQLLCQRAQLSGLLQECVHTQA